MLVGFPHAQKIFLEVLAIDGYRKLDTVQFFKHVRRDKHLESTDSNRQ